MFFIIFNNIDIRFAKKVLIGRSYTIKEALPTIRKIKLIDKQKFAKTVFDKNDEVFVVHIALLTSKITIYLARKTQIALLITRKSLFQSNKLILPIYS